MSLKRAIEQSLKKEQPKQLSILPDEKSFPESKRLGIRGEQLAAEYLIAKGFSVIDRNVRFRYGEIDIIAKKDGEIIFAEVRTRTGEFLQPANMTVGNLKLSHLVKSARMWVESRNYAGNWRIDLIAITMKENQTPKIEHIEDITEGIW